jgi:uncharacterized protein YjiS (DUF1127 family)
MRAATNATDWNGMMNMNANTNGLRIKRWDWSARITATFEDSVRALRTLMAPADAWLARHQRAARDYRELADMSDRELHDIGVSRASVRAIADEGWQRDWPR